jgi:hypothetical protein
MDDRRDISREPLWTGFNYVLTESLPQNRKPTHTDRLCTNGSSDGPATVMYLRLAARSRSEFEGGGFGRVKGGRGAVACLAGRVDDPEVGGAGVEDDVEGLGAGGGKSVSFSVRIIIASGRSLIKIEELNITIRAKGKVKARKCKKSISPSTEQATKRTRRRRRRRRREQ